MNQIAILYPVIAMAALTFIVLLLIPYQRFRAVIRKQVVADDFKFGESGSVPPAVCIPNRNYMNLLELPLLFYVGCLVMFVTQAVTPVAVGLAWAYVALRSVHSLIHLTYNNVVHRLAFFALSNVALVALWILLVTNMGK
ncbi:MAPEG family protein [Luteimonas panaciterrae]|uniref:MAPEG family protein n=1 Tax=Luteimonas panaciterrae TaxID=363885 RepID=UPI001CFC1369|nr:MAPEG family protein [Luteimonas panaciterrae]